MVSATTRIFIQPDDWAGSSAVLKVNLYYGDTYKDNVFLDGDDLYKTGIYFLDIDETQVNKFQLCRLNPYNVGDQWNYSGNISISGSAYYRMGNVYNNKTDVTISTYLPCNYYFVSDKSGTWKQVAIMTETSGTYTYTFDTDDYSGKYFAWCTGDALSADGTISNWSLVFASAGSTGSTQLMGFLKINYSDMYKDQNGQRWQVLSTLTDAYINISYTPSSHSAVVSAYRTTTIGDAGYITYSNGEKCTISGATAYRASVNNTSTVKLAEMDAATVWPEGEGMILKGNNGDVVTIHSVDGNTSASSIGNNYLVGTGNSATEVSVDANSKIYVFANDASYGIGFYKASGTGTLAAHKAYLDLSRSSFNAHDFLGFDFGEATGIANVDVNTKFDANAPMYNLAGQRVGKNYKGVVIVNGKKMLNK